MQHGLHDIYCSAQHDQCSLIIRTFWLHGVVGADLRSDNFCHVRRETAGSTFLSLRQTFEAIVLIFALFAFFALFALFAFFALFALFALFAFFALFALFVAH
jgi:hypothetical protein